jgi:hypothetical protein
MSGYQKQIKAKPNQREWVVVVSQSSLRTAQRQPSRRDGSGRCENVRNEGKRCRRERLERERRERGHLGRERTIKLFRWERAAWKSLKPLTVDAAHSRPRESV